MDSLFIELIIRLNEKLWYNFECTEPNSGEKYRRNGLVSPFREDFYHFLLEFRDKVQKNVKYVDFRAVSPSGVDDYAYRIQLMNYSLTHDWEDFAKLIRGIYSFNNGVESISIKVCTTPEDKFYYDNYYEVYIQYDGRIPIKKFAVDSIGINTNGICSRILSTVSKVLGEEGIKVIESENEELLLLTTKNHPH